MMKLVRMVAIVMLFFLGITALLGSVPMIMDPSGAMLSIPLSLLEHSPFSNFLIPGVILLCANCLLSFFVLALALRKSSGYGWQIAVQGCVLAGWISVQVTMIRSVNGLHYLYWLVALILILCGWLLRNDAAVRDPG